MNSLANGVVDSYSEFFNRLLSAWADIVSIAERIAANGAGLATDELSELLPEITAATERLRFNIIYRGPQRFAWAKIPLSDVKTIRKACGTSVNDVLLALVTTTIRRYLEMHHDGVRGRLLRMMVPVNLRGKDNACELGNRISLVPVTIPLDIRNPRKLLAAVRRRTDFLKNAHAAELISLAGGLLGILPSALQAFAGPKMSQLPITPFNMVCTNIPGPQYPLYVLGHKMLHWYPYVPLGGEMALNCAILSYNHAVYFGFSGDVHAAPDLRRLEEFLKVSFGELRDTVRPRPRKSRQPKKIGSKEEATTSRSAATAATVRESIAVTAPLPSVAPAQEPRRTAEEEKILTQLIA